MCQFYPLCMSECQSVTVMEPPPKRRCRRKKVEDETCKYVPSEAWIVICSNLFFSPHTPFRLMMAIKHLWLTMRDDVVWWKKFYDRVVKYQDCLQTSRFLGPLREFAGMPRLCYRTVLKLVYSPRCSSCGVRFGHRVFKPMMERLCGTCVRDKLISNKVLYVRYGVYFSDFLLEYVDGGGFILQCDFTKPHLSALMRYSTDPLDLEGRPMGVKGKWRQSILLYFKRDDLKRLVNLDLDAASTAARERERALRTLQAACERRMLVERISQGGLRARVIPGAEPLARVSTNWYTHKGEGFSVAGLLDYRKAEGQTEGELLRRYGLRVQSYTKISWLEGGAYYAILDLDPVNGQLLKFRPGFTSKDASVFTARVQKLIHHFRA